MSHSVFSSFDPLATHPFTNNSGLMPKPAPPSKYPLPIPSSAKTISAALAAAKSSTPTKHSIPVHSPQPKRTSPATKSSSGTRGPVFVPFRPERSSPDLDDILLKKKVSDVFSNKQTWSIDQARMPFATPSSTATTASVHRGV